MKKIICAIALLLAVSTAASAAVTIKSRRDTAANWTTNSTVVLAAGEIGVETDTLKIKIGDGATTWAALKYATEPPKEYIGWSVVNSDTATAVADGKLGEAIPAGMNGMNLVDFTCSVDDLNSATSGATTVVLRRVRGGTAVDMTSTGVTIDYNEYTASDETVDTDNDDLATGDNLYVDINSVTTAAQKGLHCTATFDRGEAWQVVGEGEATCSSPASGDRLNEGFEGTGGENTWTVETNMDDPWTGTTPTGGCSQRFTAPSGATEATWTTIDIGSAVGVQYTRFKLIIHSHSIASYNSRTLLTLSPSSDPASTNISGNLILTNASGSLKLTTISTDVITGISTGTLYSVVIKTINGGNALVQVNPGDTYSFDNPVSISTVKYQQTRYLHLRNSDPNVSYSIDAIEVDTDGSF